MLLSKDVKATRVATAQAAGQTAVTSDAVDCRDFDTVAFYVALGAVTAGGSGTVKVQHSDESATGFVDAGASVTFDDADGDGVLILEVSMPVKPFVRVVVSRADQNTVVDSVLALQGRAGKLPVSHDDTVAVSELFLAPVA